MLINIFVSIWFNPRKAISNLEGQQGRWTYLKVILTLTFTYFFALMVILWLNNLFPDPKTIMTQKILENVFWSFTLVAATVFTTFNLLSLLLYFLIQAFGGTGTILQTKAAVHWAGVSTLPVVFFIVMFTGLGMSGTTDFLLQTTSLLFAFLSLIYSFVILFKMLSETHKLNIWKTVTAIFAGVVGSGLIMTLLFFLISLF